MGFFNKDDGLFASQGRCMDEYSEAERIEMLADRDMLLPNATQWADAPDAKPPLDLEKIFSRSVEIAIAESGGFGGTCLHVKYPTPDPETNERLKTLVTAFAQRSISSEGPRVVTAVVQVALDDIGFYESDLQSPEFMELSQIIRSAKKAGRAAPKP